VKSTASCTSCPSMRPTLKGKKRVSAPAWHRPYGAGPETPFGSSGQNRQTSRLLAMNRPRELQ
jgi:hypothetical protein